ncbi:MAG: acyltransferase [Acetobacteraceae bacterium]|jgi:succinoglycan biosynthesis protein ExoH|nr:acyltransferase [Acetobacteraceae bacterium]
MIIGIVYLHCPPYVPIAEVSPGAFNFLKALVQDGLFRATVPVLTVISGYLYFRSFSADKFARNVQKKFMTLIVPMVVWNIIIFADYKIVNIMVPNIKLGRDILWWNAIFALTDQPINYPTWFLRDLFVLALLGIVFDQLLRRAPLLGLLLVVGVFLFDFDSKLLLNGSMAINFYMGGWIARSRVNVFALDRFWLPGLLAWVGLSALWVHARLENLTFLQLTMPYCIWPAMAALQRTRLAPLLLRLAPSSFSVFLLHAPFLAVLWAVYKLIDPTQAFYVAFWLAGPLLSVLGPVLVRLTVLAVSPALAGLLFGNR